MSRISLEQFIKNTKGKKIALDNGGQKGQCVSLVRQYIVQCLGQPNKSYGNAKDWVKNYVNVGLGTIVKKPQKGDIIVFPHDGVIDGKVYGHIAIYISANKMYDQNNGRHDNRAAGYGTIFTSDYVIIRPNIKLIEDTTKNIYYVDNVDYEGLNVRRDGKVIKQLPIAIKVEVIRIKDERAYINNTDYVNKDFLSKTKPSVKTVKALGGLNVRKSASILSKKITTISDGTKVKVYKTKGSWSKISPNAEAWVSSLYLK